MLSSSLICFLDSHKTSENLLSKIIQLAGVLIRDDWWYLSSPFEATCEVENRSNIYIVEVLMKWNSNYRLHLHPSNTLIASVWQKQSNKQMQSTKITATWLISVPTRWLLVIWPLYNLQWSITAPTWPKLPHHHGNQTKQIEIRVTDGKTL